MMRREEWTAKTMKRRDLIAEWADLAVGADEELEAVDGAREADIVVVEHSLHPPEVPQPHNLSLTRSAALLVSDRT